MGMRSSREIAFAYDLPYYAPSLFLRYDQAYLSTHFMNITRIGMITVLCFHTPCLSCNMIIPVKPPLQDHGTVNFVTQVSANYETS